MSASFVSQVFADNGITNKINYKSYQKVLTNVFEVDAATTMLFFKVEKEYSKKFLLKTFLIFLNFMPSTDLVEIDTHKELLKQLESI